VFLDLEHIEHQEFEIGDGGFVTRHGSSPLRGGKECNIARHC
jgi:hypothetical protein